MIQAVLTTVYLIILSLFGEMFLFSEIWIYMDNIKNMELKIFGNQDK